VLEVSAETDTFKGSPEEVLVHGIGVISPRLEVVLESGELLLETLDMGWVFVEEDGAVSSLEHLDLRKSLVLVCFFGDSASSDEALEGKGGDIPETLVLFLKQDD